MAKKQIEELKKNNPELYKQPHIQELVDQSDRLHSLKSLATTEGGKELMKLLVRDTVNSLHSLRANYKTATYTELIAIISNMAAHYDTARVLLNAEDNEKMADEQLEEFLTDALME